jgi:DNA-directed RNA polymerase subunit H (RpoH/RPB5)
MDALELAQQRVRARQFLARELAKQGYDTDVALHESSAMTLEQMAEERAGRDWRVSTRDSSAGSGGSVTVVFCDGTIKAPELQNKIAELENSEEGFDRARDTLMVVANGLSTPQWHAAQVLANEHWKRDGTFVIVRHLSTAVIDVSDNVMVPPHRKLSEAEIAAIPHVRHNRAKHETICRHDAQAIHLGMRPGDVCEITRASRTAGEAREYRLCTNDCTN